MNHSITSYTGIYALKKLKVVYDVLLIFIIINTGKTELADSAQGTALSQIKTTHVVIYITIDKKSRLQLITKTLVRMI